MLTHGDSEYFHESASIYVPAWGEQEAKWASPDDCRWEAPKEMETKASLKHLYMSALDEEKVGLVSHFFERTLSIPAASWKDVITELEHLRDIRCEDFDRITRLYEHLSSIRGMTPNDDLR